MSSLPPSLDREALGRAIGKIDSMTPVRGGLSGAALYAVRSEHGEYVLRIQGDGVDPSFWDQHLLILRRASEESVAPRVIHVDEASRAVVSERIHGVPLPAVLGDPAQRDRAIADVVERLRLLHTIDPTGVAERNPVDYGRDVWQTQRARGVVPHWATDTGSTFARAASLLERDRRRVVNHNDVNPGNVLWDGARAWLIDWEVGGLGHPFYDVATFATFLGVDAERGYALLAAQEQAPLDDEARETFAALRQLVALMVGYVFLSMVPEVAAPTRDDAPTLPDVRAAMRAGELDLQTPRGQTMLGLAFLRLGTESRA